LKDPLKFLPLLFIVILLAGCLAASSEGQSSSPTTVWDALLTRQPMSINGTPIPPGETSIVDGTYGRLDDTPPQWWRCLRCAEYRPAGGLWRLQLEKGVMRIYYEVNGWVSLASFRVEGDRLFLSDDLVCREQGEYRWHMSKSTLSLETIDDLCAFELRGRNLSHAAWQRCPEDRHAEDAPLGCGDRPAFEPFQAAPNQITVTMRQGDARKYEPPIDVIVVANKESIPTPEEIEISYPPESVEYGVNRVLWWGGDWIEARTSLPFRSMGVQFFGTSSIGWASVLFDGVEVWRGDVSAIWNHFGSYGGYIEVSGYKPGEHTLRVQLVEGDYRPLTIAIFGFNE